MLPLFESLSAVARLRLMDWIETRDRAVITYIDELGEVRVVEDRGSSLVFSISDKLYVMNGYLDSYGGDVMWDGIGAIWEAKPVTQTVINYLPV